MKSLLAEGRGEGEGHMQVLLPTFQSGEGPIDFRSEFEQEEKRGSKASGIWENFPPRPGETFHQPEMETLAPLFRSTGVVSRMRSCFRFFSSVFPYFSYFLLPLPPFFPILSLVRIYHDSQHRLNAIFLLLYRTLPKRGSARTIR